MLELLSENMCGADVRSGDRVLWLAGGPGNLDSCKVWSFPALPEWFFSKHDVPPDFLFVTRMTLWVLSTVCQGWRCRWVQTRPSRVWCGVKRMYPILLETRQHGICLLSVAIGMLCYATTKTKQLGK